MRPKDVKMMFRGVQNQFKMMLAYWCTAGADCSQRISMFVYHSTTRREARHAISVQNFALNCAVTRHFGPCHPSLPPVLYGSKVAFQPNPLSEKFLMVHVIPFWISTLPRFIADNVKLWWPCVMLLRTNPPLAATVSMISLYNIMYICRSVCDANVLKLFFNRFSDTNGACVGCPIFTIWNVWT